MFEDVCGDATISDECEHPQRVAAARAARDLVTNTLRSRAAQSSLRASVIAVERDVIVTRVPREPVATG